MSALNLTANGRPQELILAYLQENASEVLAEKINNGVHIEKDGKRLLSKKTLDGFMKYATEEAKKLAEKNARSACVEDSVVYGWAIHYFEEDTIEGTLYNEDGTEYKPVAKTVSKTTAKPVPVEPPKPKQQQTSLFDMFATPTEKPVPEHSDNDDEEEDDGEELNNDYTPEELADEEPTEEELAEAMEQETQTPLPPITKQPSPLYQHYLNIQNHYSDAIVALRVGDFYEVFGNNAITVANELDLTLTGRDFGLKERIPMVGFPFHAADSYVDKLTARGYKVAIAEDIKTNDVTVKEPELRVDEETGEVLSVEEMRKYDGDIEEADVPTVTKIVSNLGEQKTSLGTKTDDLKQAGQILQTFDETSDEDDDFPPIDTKAYDLEALSILDALFGSTMILR